MGRGLFAIIVGLIIAVLAGSLIGGRLSAQELLIIFGLFMLWAVGVSIFRAIRQIRSRLKPTRRPPDE